MRVIEGEKAEKKRFEQRWLQLQNTTIILTQVYEAFYVLIYYIYIYRNDEKT